MVDPDHSFHIADYAVFAVTIFVSLSIGIYYALSGDRQRTTSEYLVGGRSMKVLPVAISMLVSFESAVMMLGTPAEMYVYGSQYVVIGIGELASIIVSTFVFVPLIHPLKITSAYEYLQYRFDSMAVRLLGSCMGLLYNIFYMGLVIYAPAIALQAVTGFSQWSSVFIIAFVAIAYTTIGGIKSVIWTDVFQALIMYGGMLAIVIKGTMEVGGTTKVWETATTGGRMNFFNFDLDPTTRQTFWTLVFGTFIRTFSMISNQSSVQRISSIPTLREAKWLMLVISPLFAVSLTLVCYEGIVAYAYYETVGCDPLTSNKIFSSNQIIPFMMMDIFRSMPGLPGLFLASLFSASLSTLSSGLSSISALMWVDFIKPRIREVSEFKATLIAKACVVVFGIMCIGLTLVVSLIDGPFTQIFVTFLSSVGSPLLGMFMLGSLFHCANAKGTCVGATLAFAIIFWLSLGMNFNKNIKKHPQLPPVSTAMCWANESLPLFNTTTVPSANHIHPLFNTTASSVDMSSNYGFTTLGDFSQQDDQTVQGIEVVYTMSYQLLYPVGVLVTIVIGLIVSVATGGHKEPVDPRYMISLCDNLCCCLPRSWRNVFSCTDDYKAVVTTQEGAFPTMIVDKESRL